MKACLKLSSILFAFGLMVFSGQAAALCAAQDMAGEWVNEDPATKGITRVSINFACNDTVQNGVPANDPDTIQAYGKCTPTECVWAPNTLSGKFQDGRRNQTTFAEVVYNKSYATTKLKLYLIDQNHLQIVLLTDFFAPDRPDYSAIYHFRK